jgi:predicted amidohydrolase YtcJ
VLPVLLHFLLSLVARPGLATPRVDFADLILVNGRVYTLRWGEPSTSGAPAADAPRSARGWRPDAEAIAMRGDSVIFVGTTSAAQAYRGPRTRVVDLAGKTVVPGLIDAHVHLSELGANLARLDLAGVRTEQEAVNRVVERAKTIPAGQWITGSGWDEGAWANRYPTVELLTRLVPNHPVFLRGLHGFAAWGNRLAFEKAGITSATAAPTGGQILKDARGNPSGVVLNTAVDLLARAVPARTPAELERDIRAALAAMAKAGYTSVHEAGIGGQELAVYRTLALQRQLPIRVYVMLSASDPTLLREWQSRGPDTTNFPMLTIRAVKAFADGALGSRGARLLEDYSDRPGHRGTTGGRYGYDSALVAGMMRRGFQVAIHAIGDAANRETLDFFQAVEASNADSRNTRPRIEHAQVVSLDDIPRLAKLGIIASMQPSHAVEDMAWAEARVGPSRIRGAYAWRALREQGTALVFSSDLPATDYNIFYGLHSAVTRQDPQNKPAGGWYRDQAMSIEEAVRAFTTWAAYAEFAERRAGKLAVGMRADATVMTIDPFTTPASRLMTGAIAMTIAAGKVVSE